MGAYAYEAPDGAKVTDLTPEASSKPELGPETSVMVINRGEETLIRKFDGRDYPLHPHTQGLIRMPYGAALHFQKHCTVPGTRDVFSGAEESFIGILGVDPEHACRPFSQAEVDDISTRVEAIKRNPEDEPVVAAMVTSSVASGKIPVGRGQSARKGVAFGRSGKTATGKDVDRDEIMSAGGETAAERINALNEDGSE